MTSGDALARVSSTKPHPKSQKAPIHEERTRHVKKHKAGCTGTKVGWSRWWGSLIHTHTKTHAGRDRSAMAEGNVLGGGVFHAGPLGVLSGHLSRRRRA